MGIANSSLVDVKKDSQNFTTDFRPCFTKKFATKREKCVHQVARMNNMIAGDNHTASEKKLFMDVYQAHRDLACIDDHRHTLAKEWNSDQLMQPQPSENNEKGLVIKVTDFDCCFDKVAQPPETHLTCVQAIVEQTMTRAIYTNALEHTTEWQQGQNSAVILISCEAAKVADQLEFIRA